jgi:hypothetical protein
MNAILICWSCSKIFELCQTFKEFLSYIYVYVVVLSGILFTQHEHMLGFLSVTTRQVSLIVTKKDPVFFVIASIFSPNISSLPPPEGDVSFCLSSL